MGQTELRWYEWPFHGTSAGGNDNQELLVASQSTTQVSEVDSPNSWRVTRQKAKIVLKGSTLAREIANMIGMLLLQRRRGEAEEQSMKHRVPGLQSGDRATAIPAWRCIQ